jgi:predicted transcriptional regulator
MARERKAPTKTVRVSLELARKLDIIAAVRGVSVPELLDELLTPLVAREFPKAADEVNKLKGDTGKRKGGGE